MNAIKNGVTDNWHAIRPDYNQVGISTWPQILSEAGYYTAAIGKMHFSPWDARHGFSHRVIAEDKRWLHIRDDYYTFLSEHGLRKMHGNEHEGYRENKGAVVSRIPWAYSWDRFVGQEACRFIEAYDESGPFAMMVGFPGPHDPYDPAADFPHRFDPQDMPDAIPPVPEDSAGFRARNIREYAGGSAGLDLTEFTDAHKRKIRAHYAGLVKQIDYEVCEIVGTLRTKGILDSTAVILSTDHGDHLGDHDLMGKSTFFESAVRIPLLVSAPGSGGGSASGDLVELRDITATILRLAGCDIPRYMDAQTLPGLGLSDDPPRSYVFGMLSDGWMAFDGEWKLAKYAGGETLLYNVKEDPGEQRNRAQDPELAHVYRRLDAELTREIMDSVRFSAHDRLPAPTTLSGDEAFGREGWKWDFPSSVDKAL